MNSVQNESSTPLMSSLNKPPAVLFAQIVLGLSALGAFRAELEIMVSSKKVGAFPLDASFVALGYFCVILAAVALMVLLNRRKNVRWLTISYLLSALLFFPVLLRLGIDSNVFMPLDLLPRELLAANGMVEKIRLVLFLLAALSLGISPRAKVFLNSGSNKALNPDAQKQRGG